MMSIGSTGRNYVPDQRDGTHSSQQVHPSGTDPAPAFTAPPGGAPIKLPSVTTAPRIATPIVKAASGGDGKLRDSVTRSDSRFPFWQKLGDLTARAILRFKSFLRILSANDINGLPEHRQQWVTALHINRLPPSEREKLTADSLNSLAPTEWGKLKADLLNGLHPTELGKLKADLLNGLSLHELMNIRDEVTSHFSYDAAVAFTMRWLNGADDTALKPVLAESGADMLNGLPGWAIKKLDPRVAKLLPIDQAMKLKAEVLKKLPETRSRIEKAENEHMILRLGKKCAAVHQSVLDLAGYSEKRDWLKAVGDAKWLEKSDSVDGAKKNLGEILRAAVSVIAGMKAAETRKALPDWDFLTALDIQSLDFQGRQFDNHLRH